MCISIPPSKLGHIRPNTMWGGLSKKKNPKELPLWGELLKDKDGPGPGIKQPERGTREGKGGFPLRMGGAEGRDMA